MREKIVLRRRTTPKFVTLPDGTTFTARYQRISRKQLPRNIPVKKTRKIGARNRNKSKMGPGPTKSARVNKKVRLTPSTSLCERLARTKRYKASKKEQTGKGLASDLAKIGINLGSQAINSNIGKKIINKGIDSIPNIFKYGVLKIKNKNVKRAMKPDIANIVVDEAQNRINKRFSDSLFKKKWVVQATFKLKMLL